MHQAELWKVAAMLAGQAAEGALYGEGGKAAYDKVTQPGNNYPGTSTAGDAGRVSGIDRAKISKWTNTPSDELYIKYKDVYDNPKYFNQETGKPIYPGTNGNPNINGFVKGVSRAEILQPGARIDRYGPPAGKFASPEGTPYGERALAPGANPEDYHVYVILKPVEVQSGTVYPWFDEVGGGISKAW